jgi:hypothetical protein
LNVGEAEFGSQLSGKILEKVKTDPERFWSGAVCVQFM